MDNDIDTSKFKVDDETLALIVTLIASLIIGLIFIRLNYWITIGIFVLGFAYIKLQQAQLIGNALEVRETQFTDLYRIFQSQKQMLNIKNVNLYIRQDPCPNAYTIGFPTASIVLASSLVENLSLDELSFVIAHELGHVKLGHNIYLTFVNPIGDGIPGGSILFSYWRRKAEYSCDRCALVITKSIKSAITSLFKLSYGLKFEKEINLDIYKDQLMSSESNFVSLSEFMYDHPLTTNRIRKMILYWKDNFIKKQN